MKMGAGGYTGECFYSHFRAFNKCKLHRKY